MHEMVLLQRVYGQYRNRMFSTVTKEIDSMTEELNVKVSYRITRNNHIQVNIEGDDAEFVTNLLSKEFGRSLDIKDIEVGAEYNGQLVDVGRVGFGLYTDIGVIGQNQIDALIPLFTLRRQLGMKKKPVRAIADTFVLVDNLPVELHITGIDRDNHKIQAEFTDGLLDRINGWSSDDHERLIVLGIPRRMIHSVLSKTGHINDIYNLEQLGRFEFALQCKRSTRASGIVSKIGPYLKGVPIHLFIPHEIEAKKDAPS